MQIRLKNTHLHIDWLMLLFPCIAAALGEGRMAALLMLSLFAHEAAHLAAARALRVPIHMLRLTPFGGMAQIENPYAVSAARLILISVAGPGANLLLILLAAALCHWQLLSSFLSAELIQINAMLMLFNLLPALPLDGGRILYALLSMFIPRRRAVEAGILIGRILAALLILLALWGCAVYHHLNLSPVFAALFLLASARDERTSLTDSRLRTLLDSICPISEPQPAALVAISSDTAPETALRAAWPDRVTLFAVFEQNRFTRIIDDRTLLNRIIDNSHTPGNASESTASRSGHCSE